MLQLILYERVKTNTKTRLEVNPLSEVTKEPTDEKPEPDEEEGENGQEPEGDEPEGDAAEEDGDGEEEKPAE
jgi:hypothetical protein